MAKKVFIHPGFPKSGTTALQASLMQAQEKLSNHDLHFAPKWNNAHHRAAWALTNYTFGWEENGGEKTPIAAWQKLCEEINNAADSALISSEFLMRANEAQIESIKTLIQADKFEIVFTMRPFAKVLPSRYQQSLKKGKTWSFDEWLQLLLDETKQKTSLVDYAGIISLWAEVFGKENISLIIADENNPDFLYQSFESVLGLEAATLKPAKVKRLNRSLTASEVEILRQINLRKPKKWKWKQYNLFVRGKFVRQLSDKPSAFKDETKLALPDWALLKLEPYSREQIQRINDLGIQVIGSTDSLYEKSKGSSSTTTGQIPAEMAADLVIQLASIPSVKDARTRDLVREIISRIKKRLK